MQITLISARRETNSRASQNRNQQFSAESDIDGALAQQLERYQ